MKKLLFLVLVLASAAARSEPAKRIKIEQLFVPLGEHCEQYYSLNTPGKICLNGELHFQVYDVTYEVHGEVRKVRLTYVPAKTFEVDESGIVKPRNHAIRPDQRF